MDLRKLLIIKAGRALPSIVDVYGDYEDWIIAAMQIDPNQVWVIEVCRDESLPPPDEVGGVVITGSRAMVTDQHAWSERTARWLIRAIEAGLPVLGICYGHQLLAYALGGKVGNNPHGHELGTVSVHLTDHVRRDPLLGGFESPIRVLVNHRQSVLTLPSGSIRLGWSDGETNQVFRLADTVWGLQFHPEFTAEIVRASIDSSRESLVAAGFDPDGITAQLEDSPCGRKILSRFAHLVGMPV